MYSGEKLASLNALLTNLEYARSQKLAPVETSTYAAIAEGFYTTRFIRLGDRMWRVEDRNHLNTIRFDHATFQTVDFNRSVGVLGQHHVLGALYVALDPLVAQPMLVLADSDRADREPAAEQPYLIECRWLLSGLERSAGGGLKFQAHGFGNGEMVWQLPGPGRFDVVAEAGNRTLWQGRAETNEADQLTVTIPVPAIDPPLNIRITPAL